MRATRHDPIAIPLGHVEQPRPHRAPAPVYGSGYTAAEQCRLDVPTVTRRLGEDLAASHGAARWEDVPADVRAEMRDAMVCQLAARLGKARTELVLRAHFGAPPLWMVERVARLERALHAAQRLA